ncbi:MAG: hypothetical protein HY329_14965 [Chloroflexi bacterium]|nr:hypothetical protein [Chloroflexota bacterium]
MRDAIELERRGVPAVAIHTSIFMNSADAHAVAYGRPDFQSIPIPHPIAGRPGTEVAQKAERFVPEVVALLLGQRHGNSTTEPAPLPR